MKNHSLYPLTFQPIFRDYLWGGTRLSSVLHKPTGPGQWAESWEICDHPSENSVVASGSLKGKTLQELMLTFQDLLVGASVWAKVSQPSIPANLRGRFPLLVKFLDAAQVLSVQVHPNDEQGAKLSPPDLGKTEAWYVIDATPDAVLYAGLNSSVDRTTFERALTSQKVETCLHSFAPARGDCIFIPAGTQHAIGAGLLILEVQQASNTTFRVFDWNRVDTHGKSRDLHIDQALSVTDFQLGPVQPQSRTSVGPALDQLVACDYFQILEQTSAGTTTFGSSNSFEVVVVLHGSIEVAGQQWTMGQTILFPAALGAISGTAGSNTKILRISIP